MRESLLRYLVCPRDHAELSLSADTRDGDRIATGTLRCSACQAEYPIRHYVPRFVADDQYVASFSHEWTRFARTQLDSVNGTDISLQYFRNSVKRAPADYAGSLVLDAGCGTGRMLELFADVEATVIGIDLSYAVDSAVDNVGKHPHLHVVQASIYDLPFRPATFDFAYSIGVLHHTPDPERAFRAVQDVVRPGGDVGIRVLSKRMVGGVNLDWIFPLFLYRHVTRRARPDHLLAFLKGYVPVACSLRRIPLVGQFFRWLLPVADYHGVHPLDDEQLRQWNILDTFDRFSPRYYFRYSDADLRAWFPSDRFDHFERGTFPVSARGRRASASRT
ncbi:MAG TPA: methyltransferase domain-containing protein [Candidatus Krumholzibacteria bacterium]|nr:methyltransferase domain-containing protein [Candidatus Krumholzibacteria bacterium]